MRKKECYNSNFVLFWESFDFLNSFNTISSSKSLNLFNSSFSVMVPRGGTQRLLCAFQWRELKKVVSEALVGYLMLWPLRL